MRDTLKKTILQMSTDIERKDPPSGSIEPQQMIWRLIFAFLLLTTLVISCKKNQEPQEGNLLKRIVTTSSFAGGIDSFFYDNQKRLTAIKVFNNQDYNKFIEYGPDGNIFRVIYKYQGADVYSFKFIRNSLGQIIRKSSTPSPGFQYAFDQSYTYDNAGRLVSDTTYYKQTDSVLYYGSYKYDNNGNIFESDFYDLINTNNHGKTTNVFDNKTNPYKMQGWVYYFVTDNPSYLNQNNIVEWRSYWSPPRKNELTYQTNGLPKTISTEDPISPIGPIKSTQVFEYW